MDDDFKQFRNTCTCESGGLAAAHLCWYQPLDTTGSLFGTRMLGGVSQALEVIFLIDHTVTTAIMVIQSFWADFRVWVPTHTLCFGDFRVFLVLIFPPPG
jgi:hypothetical protein